MNFGGEKKKTFLNNKIFKRSKMQKEKFNKLPTYKIILLGGCSVGKTCMANQFVNNYFYMRDEETNEDLR